MSQTNLYLRWTACGVMYAALAAGCAADSDSINETGELDSLLAELDADAAARGHSSQPAPPSLVARAVLPASTFARGPTSGKFIGTAPINGFTPPFIDRQPVQGFSAALREADGSLLVMADNGFGGIENSADFNLRVYRIDPHFKTRFGGSGGVDVGRFIELHDPDHKIPFVITNELSADRVLTGADFDIESLQRAPDGSLWFGDEFGPFLVHTDARGRVLEAPIRIPNDPGATGPEIRSPQNPFSEEATAIRIMNAMAAHARAHGATRAPVASPDSNLLADGDPTTFEPTREAPPAGSGVATASSELFDVALLKTAGYAVVPYTVNDPARMRQLLALGVSGLISDRPDLLFAEIAAFDANRDGVPGDLLDANGLIDGARFDAQGHRGSRNLRPENTLPAFEAALDHLVTTLELDIGITADQIPVIDHDPHVQSEKCRRTNGAPYTLADEVLVKDLRFTDLQRRFICDKLFRGPSQVNDPALSPVAAAFRAANPALPHIYAMPSLPQLFAFVDHYVAYYTRGAGARHPDAARRARNAARVRFNIETKINPRAEFANRTLSPETFVRVIGQTITRAGLAARADVQSFDFRSLLLVHRWYPQIRTVCLFGDFPVFADPSVAGSDDGTNLQPEPGRRNTPWLAGLAWPYRSTAKANPFRAARSGGFEGMALSADGRHLYPLLEQPVAGDEPKTLRIYDFDLRTRRIAGIRATYRLDARGTNIGDFQMIDGSKGLIIERDGSQGDLNGWKQIFQIRLGSTGALVDKQPLVDLVNLRDPFQISLPGRAGDVGLGTTFAFPFTTIEDVVVLGRRTILVINDNNFPFSLGRHLGSGAADDNELIIVDVGRDLY